MSVPATTTPPQPNVSYVRSNVSLRSVSVSAPTHCPYIARTNFDYLNQHVQAREMYAVGDYFSKTRIGQALLNILSRLFGSAQELPHIAPPTREAQILEMKKTAMARQCAVFETAFYSSLEKAMNQWNHKTIHRLAGLIRTYLARSDFTPEERATEKKWIEEVLKENLSPAEHKRLSEEIVASQKRGQQQAPQLAIYEKQYLFPNQLGLPSGEVNLCGTEDYGVALNGYTSSGRPYLRTVVFSSASGAIEVMQNASDVLSAQLDRQISYLGPQDQHRSACRRGIFHGLSIIGSNNGIVETLHHMIQNQTLSIPQYRADYHTLTYTNFPSFGPPLTYPWKPAALTGNQAAFVSHGDAGSYLIVSNSSGLFSTDTSGNAIGTQLEWTPMHHDVLSMGDGSFRLFSSDGVQLLYDVNRTLVSSKSIFDNQTLPGITTPNTPIPVGTSFATFISAGENQTHPTLYTFDMNDSEIITSVRPLGTEPSKISHPVIANCAPQHPHIHVYARESFDLTGNRLIKFDFVDANDASSSLTGSEQIYANYTGVNGTVFSRPNVACFSDLLALFAFTDEDQNAARFTVQLNLEAPSTPSPSVPSPTPVISPQPSSSSPTIDTTQITIEIKLPLNLGQTVVPITPDILTISNNTAIITLIDTHGFNILYADGTPVPLLTNFTRTEIYGLGISLGNGTVSQPPVFQGCTVANVCSLSRAVSQLEQTVTIEGTDMTLVIALSVTIPVAVAIAATIFYFTVFRKQQKQRIARYDEWRDYKANRADPRKDVEMKDLPKNPNPLRGDLDRRERHFRRKQFGNEAAQATHIEEKT